MALLLELRGAGVGWVSAVLAADLVPFVVFASFSGRLVDRADNRQLLVIALAAQGLLVLPLAFVRTAWVVVLLVFAVASFSTLVRPAVNALVPVLAGDERAPSAYAWVATGNGIGYVVGTAAGGLLTAAFGIAAALFVDTVTFVVLAAACALLSASRGGAAAAAAAADSRLGGITILWRDTVLRWSVIVTAIAVACMVVDNVAAPFRFIDQLRTSSSGYGFYLAVWATGGLVGAQVPRYLGSARMPTLLAVGNTVSALGVAGIGLAPHLGMALGASAVGGVGNGIANVSLSALVTGRVVEGERGRAFATVAAFVQAGVGAGTVAGAPLVAWLTAGHAMAAAGALATVIAGTTVIWTVLRVP